MMDDVTAGDAIVYEEDIQPIWTASCGGPMCHSGRSPMLLEENSYDNIVGATSDDGNIYVDPGSVATSYLYSRLLGEMGEVQMPRDRPPLSDDQLQLIESWIASGAPR